MKQNAYKEAGVDIDAGAELVERIKPAIAKTKRSGVMGSVGGFGALFDVKAAGYQDPVLVSATDGVGTKIKIAIDTNRHDNIGIDLVAMCVNDLIVQGAEPLFFLDYFATSKLDVEAATKVVNGIARGCEESGCALIGGETAEMPGMYAAGDYDLAGFCVGAVERDEILTGETIKEGDIVLGLASSGLHSNGYSLVRKIMSSTQGYHYDSPAPFAENGETFGEIFLTPTRLYVRSILNALKTHKGAIKGLANITGGGLLENIPRVLPDGLGVDLDAASWPLPEQFKWLRSTGDLDPTDMARTLNCGIGMIVICAPEDTEKLSSTLEETGERVFRIGHVNANEAGEVTIRNMQDNWLF